MPSTLFTQTHSSTLAQTPLFSSSLQLLACKLGICGASRCKHKSVSVALLSVLTGLSNTPDLVLEAKASIKSLHWDLRSRIAANQRRDGKWVRGLGVPLDQGCCWRFTVLAIQQYSEDNRSSRQRLAWYVIGFKRVRWMDVRSRVFKFPDHTCFLLHAAIVSLVCCLRSRGGGSEGPRVLAKVVTLTRLQL